MAFISIITINYNNAEGLEKTIHSVISQTFKDTEFIIIDGGSTDASKTIIQQFTPKISHWVSEKDKGIYDAQNKGIVKASGKYLLFLNSGDRLVDENVLYKVAPQLSGEKSFYFGSLILEKEKAKEKHEAPDKIDLDFMINSTFWHPCVFIKSDLFKSYGLFHTSFKIAGDYEFFIRCLLKPGITTEKINEFITLFDSKGISNDPMQEKLIAEERDRSWKMNVSEMVYNSLKKQNSFSRSKYVSIINLIQKMRGKESY